MGKLKMTVGGLAALLLAACAGHKTVIGERHDIERIPAGDRPSWVGVASPDFGDGKLYFHGVADSRDDMQLCLREAEAGGKKTMAGMLMERLRGQFDTALQGENKNGNLGRWSGDYFRSQTEDVRVSGARLAKQVIEVKKENTRTGVRYSYDCYVLVSLSQADYEDARAGVLDGLRGKAKSELNRDARETFERVMDKLERRAPAPDASAGR